MDRVDRGDGVDTLDGVDAEVGSREVLLAWSVHLAASRPRRAAVIVLVALASALLCHQLFGNLLFALFSCAVILAATAEFLFPIRFQLDSEGAEMRNLHNWRRIAWVDVKKAYLLEDGLKLSPLGVRSRLENFRGVFLRFGPGGDREAVLAVVKACRDAARRNPE